MVPSTVFFRVKNAMIACILAVMRDIISKLKSRGLHGARHRVFGTENALWVSILAVPQWYELKM